MTMKFGRGPGFTLVGTVIGIALFVIISASVIVAYANVVETIRAGQWRIEATTLVEKEMETVRAMAFEDVGVSGGYPPGKLSASKSITSGSAVFLLKTFVRNVDDPFDGTLGGTPNDTSPADYKIVEFEISCVTCSLVSPIVMTATVAPRGLEGDTNNGSLFINVFDAAGNPISGASVHVENNAVSSSIVIDDVTNNSGVLQLVDIPTSTEGYEVTVTKEGYSTDRTYVRGAPENPNPVHPHVTVAQRQLTSASFSIDRTSLVNVNTMNAYCSNMASTPFTLIGDKLIGEDPDVNKYSSALSTDPSGHLTLEDMEWDTYTLALTSPVYDAESIWPLPPFVVNPFEEKEVNITLVDKNPLGLLVSVEDNSGNPVAGASVTLSRTGFSETRIAGEREASETSWSGGNYASKSSGVTTEDPAGAIRLADTGGIYPTSTEEWLISRTFDFGVPSVAYGALSWSPTTQPPETGIGSVRFQVASNDDNATWNFVGPDGTAGSYFTATGTLPATVDAHRYFRYKVSLSTQDENATPSVEEVSFTFSSPCFADYQAYFQGLTSGTYTLTVAKAGFQDFSNDAVSVAEPWQSYRAVLNPQ